MISNGDWGRQEVKHGSGQGAIYARRQSLHYHYLKKGVWTRNRPMGGNAGPDAPRQKQLLSQAGSGWRSVV